MYLCICICKCTAHNCNCVSECECACACVCQCVCVYPFLLLVGCLRPCLALLPCLPGWLASLRCYLTARRAALLSLLYQFLFRIISNDDAVAAAVDVAAKEAREGDRQRERDILFHLAGDCECVCVCLLVCVSVRDTNPDCDLE